MSKRGALLDKINQAKSTGAAGDSGTKRSRESGTTGATGAKTPDEKSFECPHCPRTYKTEGALKRHVETKHRPPAPLAPVAPPAPAPTMIQYEGLVLDVAEARTLISCCDQWQRTYRRQWRNAPEGGETKRNWEDVEVLRARATAYVTRVRQERIVKEERST